MPLLYDVLKVTSFTEIQYTNVYVSCTNILNHRKYTHNKNFIYVVLFFSVIVFLNCMFPRYQLSMLTFQFFIVAACFDRIFYLFMNLTYHTQCIWSSSLSSIPSGSPPTSSSFTSEDNIVYMREVS